MSVKYELKGEVYSRSSKKESGPPSEREILKLNPEREKALCKVFKWDSLEPGSLNLMIPDKKLKVLSGVQPVLTESDVKYPEGYEKIPLKRQPYLYYKCKVYNGKKKIKALARRASNPVKNCLEIFAEKNLRDKCKLKDGDSVTIRVYGKEKIKEIKNSILEPFFMNVYKEPARIENTMTNGHAFLVCSGPSFADMNKKPLRYCYTMAINNATKACMPHFRPDSWICVDGADKFLYTVWEDPKIMKLVPESHRHKPLWNSDTIKPHGKKVSDCPSVYFWKRNNVFDAKRFLTENTINWGNGSDVEDSNGVKGKRSVMHSAIKILYLLGFRHVYLLGCDFNMDMDNPYSFDQDKTKGGCSGNNSSYEQMNYRFAELRPYFEKADFNVYNCNKDSGLTAFKYMDYSEALDRALGFVDDRKAYTSGSLESTANLYQTKWYVCPKCKLDQRVSKKEVKKGLSCSCGREITQKDRKKYVKDKGQKGLDS